MYTPVRVLQCDKVTTIIATCSHFLHRDPMAGYEGDMKTMPNGSGIVRIVYGPVWDNLWNDSIGYKLHRDPKHLDSQQASSERDFPPSVLLPTTLNRPSPSILANASDSRPPISTRAPATMAASPSLCPQCGGTHPRAVELRHGDLHRGGGGTR